MKRWHLSILVSLAILTGILPGCGSKESAENFQMRPSRNPFTILSRKWANYQEEKEEQRRREDGPEMVIDFFGEAGVD